jgi:ATP-dependent Lon protease
VLFICTGNTTSTIPAPLLDRMEVIMVDGYTEYDKVHIAKQYLVPRQLKVNGLREEEIEFTDDALRTMIRDYTQEAGVRQLERTIGKACRKVATLVAERGDDSEPESAEGEDAKEPVELPIVVDEEKVRDYLGKPRYRFEAALRTEKPGVATGLAWTPTGGKVLFIEAATMPGKKDELILTGQLGDVMRESARIGLSYVESHAKELGLDIGEGTGRIHLHVPAGAVPKDGPSAGITMVTALVSLLSDRPVDADVGMTGEISLQGQVLPIGGLKLKVLAAHRAGLKKVIVPKLNEIDIDEIPDKVKEEIEFVLVDDIAEVLEHALMQADEAEAPAAEQEEIREPEAVVV